MVVRGGAERGSEAKAGRARRRKGASERLAAAHACHEQRRTGGGRESGLQFKGPCVETPRRGLAKVRAQLLARRRVLSGLRHEGLVDVGEARRPDEVLERQRLLVRPSEEHGGDGRVRGDDRALAVRRLDLVPRLRRYEKVGRVEEQGEDVERALVHLVLLWRYRQRCSGERVKL